MSRRAVLTQRTVLASVIGFLAAVLLPLAAPGLLPVASAHDTLISSSPATGESLEQAPKTLELTYSDEVLNLAPVVRLSNSAGEEIFTQTPAVSGNTASIDLPALPADSYRVQWRVVSSDGHPIEGTVDFTVTVGAETTDDADTASDPASPTAAADSPQPEPTPVDQAESSPAEQEDSGLSSGMVLAGATLLLLLLVVVVVLVLRTTRQRAGRGRDH